MTDSPDGEGQAEGRGWLERLLAPFAEVHRGEGAIALLLALNLFLLLSAYYFIKPVRDSLILSVEGGPQLKAYLAAGQAVLLVLVVKLYAWLANRFGAVKLILGLGVFFTANLLIFYALVLGKANVAIAFFVWVGIFNLMMPAQFWAFANDIYSPAQGKRLFALVGAGSSVGALAGAYVAQPLIRSLGKDVLLPAAAGILVLCMINTVLIARLRSKNATEAERAKAKDEDVIGGEGAFTLIARDRYLILIGALVVLLNWVNSTGEFIFDTALKEAALAEIPNAASNPELQQDFIAAFKSRFYAWMNLSGVVLQLLFVSRAFKYLGVRGALFILPVISLVGYGAIGLAPALAVIFVAKVAENSTDYSVMSTTKQALWLITPREAKYKAKSAIDSILVRFGDTLVAGTVFAGTAIGLGVGGFAAVNIALIFGWIGVAIAIAKIHKARSPEA